jgi:dynein heavy chain
MQVMEQRRRLPPVLNDKSLFTKAAPYGDRGDQGYHSPCNRIGVNYSPASGAAASLLFEEYPQVCVDYSSCCSSRRGLLREA